jgi:hypothetical protein
MQWDAPEEPYHICFSPGGLLLATTCALESGDRPEEGQDVLRLWDVLRGEEIAHLDGIGDIMTLCFAAERQVLIVEYNRCLLWDADSGTTQTIRRKRNERYLSGAVSLDEHYIAVCEAGEDGGPIFVLEQPDWVVRHRLRTPPTTNVNYDDLVAVGPWLAGVCRANRDEFTLVALWDAAQGKRLRTYDLSGEGDVCPLVIRPDGAGLAVVTSRAVHAFGLEYEDELGSWKPHRADGVYDLRYSRDGRTLEVLERDRRERLQLVRLDANTGEVLAKQRVPIDSEWRFAILDPASEKVALTVGRTIQVLDLPDM